MAGKGMERERTAIGSLYCRIQEVKSQAVMPWTGHMSCSGLIVFLSYFPFMIRPPSLCHCCSPPTSWLYFIILSLCTLFITRTCILGWRCPSQIPFLFLLILRLITPVHYSLLGPVSYDDVTSLVPLLSFLTHLRCCSLGACTLDLTFWVYTALEPCP